MAAVETRVEDAELERMLKEYQNESRSKNRKKMIFMEKPLDLPYYKGIQLPNHLKWITVQSVSATNLIANLLCLVLKESE